MTASIAIVQIPFVQLKLVNYTTEYLSELVKYPIQVGYVSISWLDKIVLHQVQIKDKEEHDMVSLEKIYIDFSLLSLLGKDVVMEEIKAARPKFQIYWSDKVDDVNISDFISALKNIGKDPTKPNKPHIGRYINFVIKQLIVENGYFSYEDPTQERLIDRFDFLHFTIDSIYGTATNFLLVADTINMDIQNLKAKDVYSGLKIKQLSTNFSICENFLELSNTKAYIGDSYWSDYLRFEYKNYSQFSYIQDSVYMELRPKNAILKSQDIAIFIPEANKYNDTWYVSAQLTGIFKNLRGNIASFKFGNQSLAVGSVHIRDLPDLDKAKFDMQFDVLHLYMNDVIQYGLKPVYEYAKNLQFIRGETIYSGTISNFYIHGNWQTQLGNTTVDGIIKFADKPQHNKYNLNIGIQEFNTSSFTNANIIVKKGNVIIHGSGNDLTNFNMHNSIYIHTYSINNIIWHDAIIDIKSKQGIYDFNVHTMDSKLRSNFNININLINNQFQLKTKGTCTYIDLLKSGILKQSAQGKFNFNISYSSDSSATNLCHISNFNFNNNTDTLEVKNIEIKYMLNKSNKIIDIHSNVIQLHMFGDFEIKNLESDISYVFKIIQAKLMNTDSTYYLYKQKNKLNNKNIQLNCFFGQKTESFFNIFLPDLFFSTNSTVSFGYKKMDTLCSAYIKIKADKFRLKEFTFKQFEIDFSTQQSLHNISNATIFSLLFSECLKQQDKIAGDLNYKVNWQDSILYQKLNVGKILNFLDVNFDATYHINSANSSTLFFNNFICKIQDDIWKLYSKNSITIFNFSKFKFDNFFILSENQKVSVMGTYSENEVSPLIVDFKNISLLPIGKLIDKKIYGKLNANLDIYSLRNMPKILSKFDVDSFQILKFVLGNISGSTKWNSEKNVLDLSLEVTNKHVKLVDIFGTVNLNLLKEQSIKLVCNFKETPLVLLEPFTEGIISDISGFGSGQVLITGPINNLFTYGDIELMDGSFTIDYLNAKFYTNEQIYIRPNGLLFQNLIIQDFQGGSGVINGGIYHTSFTNVTFDVKGIFNKAQVLNTSNIDNSTYYGKAIASGDFSIEGRPEKVKYTINARSEKGTHLWMPISNEETLDNGDFITFKKRKSLSKKISNTNNINNNIELHINLELTPHALCEIVLDPISGDKISGYGNGKFRMEYDTKGDFQIFGNYVFDKESYYAFSFLNIINKKFTINKGSKIVMNGDPYAGLLDINAAYEDRVSLYPLVDTIYHNRPGVRTPYPVSTLLYLKGDLLNPEISYDILIKDYPPVISGCPLFSYVSAFENRIRNNENDMNNQVFALLVFRRFFNPNVGFEMAGSAAGSTVSELLSNQLSQIASTLDKNLDVNLNLNNFNRDAINQMQVRLSYTLLDGKVRITRSGAFTNYQNQATAASIAGDWTVEYILSDDGKFRLKAFNRQNPNIFSISGNGASNQTGASIMHTQTFEYILPGKKRKRKAQESNSK